MNDTFGRQNKKLMVVIDELDDSEKVLEWINNNSGYSHFTWLVVFGESDLSDSHLSWLNENFQIAEKMGAEKIFCLRINDVSTLLKIASANYATHIICSKWIKRKLQLFLFIKEFMKRLRNPNGQYDKLWFNEDDRSIENRNMFIGNN